MTPGTTPGTTPSARDLAALRADFPALQRLRRGKPPIYFNNT